MKRLGERIKQKRERMHMSLGDLAKLVGISSSALSQIENAKAHPSIVHLKAIADHLHATVGEIIGEHETLLNNPRVRNSEKSFIKENKSGAKLYLLSHHDPSKKMETYMLEFVKNSDAHALLKEHPAQEFIYVVTGEIVIRLDNKNYDLMKGDSFYFNASLPHQIMNTYQGKSELIRITTPL